MNIDLAKLDYAFETRPLLIGGMAMEFYDLRRAGNDIDYVVTVADYARLAQKYPGHLKDLGGDLGVCVYEFEIWKSICLFDYEYLLPGAIDQGEYLVISLEKLLFLKALGVKEDKYRHDLERIVKKITDDRYAAWWAALPEEQRKKYR